jgi:hypothetical protein
MEQPPQTPITCDYTSDPRPFRNPPRPKKNEISWTFVMPRPLIQLVFRKSLSAKDLHFCAYFTGPYLDLRDGNTPMGGAGVEGGKGV